MELTGLPNFLDILFLIICLRVVYVAAARGMIAEGLKGGGLLAGSLLAFHYYTFIGDRFTAQGRFIRPEYFDFISFFFILVAAGLIFALTRLIVMVLFKRDEIPATERWLALFAGGARAIILSSVLIFLLHLSPLEPRLYNQSFSWKFAHRVAPKVYLESFKLYRHFVPTSQVNKEVQKYYETQADVSGNHSSGQES